MPLVDTSVWIDHLRASDDALTARLRDLQVLVHPFVIGEIALGSLRDRTTVMVELERLPRSSVESDRSVLEFIETHALGGSGIG